MEHPGEVTKMWRKEQKRSIHDVAVTSGVDKNTISRFERGSDFRMRVFKSVCQALGHKLVDAYAILGVGGAQPALGSSACCDCHAEIHRQLTAVLHTHTPEADDLIGNIDVFYRFLLPGAGGNTPESDDPPGIGVSIRTGRTIGERHGRRQKDDRLLRVKS